MNALIRRGMVIPSDPYPYSETIIETHKPRIRIIIGSACFSINRPAHRPCPAGDSRLDSRTQKRLHLLYDIAGCGLPSQRFSCPMHLG